MKFKLFSAAALCSASLFLAACGSDSSSSSPSAPSNAENSSSSIAGNPAEGPTTPNGSSDSNEGTSPAESFSSVVNPGSSENTASDNCPTGYAVDENGFFSVADVYRCLGSNEKVTFVLRHAERESGLGFESPLTEVGVQQSKDLGAQMASDESFAYASSGFVRTTNTCKNIAIGRGEGDVDVAVLENLDGNWFVAIPSDSLEAKAKSKGGTPTVVAKWVYTGANADWFYDFETRGNEFIQYIVSVMETSPRVNVYVTHDLLVMPLVAYASERLIDMQIYKSKQWLNFLAGVAVITDQNGSFRVLPVKGTESGIQ